MGAKNAKKFSFPYVLIGIALAVALFYRSPEGEGHASAGPASVSRPVVPSLPPGELGVKPDVRLSEPVVATPSVRAAATKSLKVAPPSVRKSTAPEPQAMAGQSAPKPPDPVHDKIYLPDSPAHALPALPVIPEDVRQRAKPAVPFKLKVISQGSESVNQVALTFDDGPNNKYTPQILEILNQYNVKGTFFVLGEQVRQHPEVLRRVADEGHEIGNHSFSHAQFNRSSEAKVREELVSTQDAIRAVLGYVPKLMRPPYGAYRDSNLALFEELGLSVVLWSVDTYDWKRKGEAIIRTVDRQTKNGSIILLHDRKSETVRVLPQIIEGLRSRGYKLVTVSELTGMPAYDYGAPVARGDGGEEPKS